MPSLQRILLVDDSPRDTEMVLHALESDNLANEVVTLRDGAEALDCRYRRGPFAGRGVNARVVKPVPFHEFVEAVKLAGGFSAP